MANEALRLIGTSAGRDAEQRGDELNLRELWRAILRRKFVLLTTIIAITGGDVSRSSRSRRRSIRGRS